MSTRTPDILRIKARIRLFQIKNQTLNWVIPLVIRFVVYGFILMSFVFLMYFFFFYWLQLSQKFSPDSLESYAQIGDSFGVWSSLFSVFGFGGLLYTVILQRKTMIAQMQELKLARKEYSRQGKALEGQEKVMSEQFRVAQLQQFSTVFFRLLENHKNIADVINIEISNSDSSKKNLPKECKGVGKLIDLVLVNQSLIRIDEYNFSIYEKYHVQYLSSLHGLIGLLFRNRKVLGDDLGLYTKIIKVDLSRAQLKFFIYFSIQLLEKKDCIVQSLEIGLLDINDFSYFIEENKYMSDSFSRFDHLKKVISLFDGMEIKGFDIFFSDAVRFLEETIDREIFDHENSCIDNKKYIEELEYKVILYKKHLKKQLKEEYHSFDFNEWRKSFEYMDWRIKCYHPNHPGPSDNLKDVLSYIEHFNFEIDQYKKMISKDNVLKNDARKLKNELNEFVLTSALS